MIIGSKSGSIKACEKVTPFGCESLPPIGKPDDNKGKRRATPPLTLPLPVPIVRDLAEIVTKRSLTAAESSKLAPFAIRFRPHLAVDCENEEASLPFHYQSRRKRKRIACMRGGFIEERVSLGLS